MAQVHDARGRLIRETHNAINRSITYDRDDFPILSVDQRGAAHSLYWDSAGD